MKRILRWGLMALGLLIVVVLALPFLLPTSVYKEQIIEQARLATGRTLTIDGDLNVSFFPTLGVEVHKVRFANAEGAAEADMATMESLVVGAELWPLLGGTLKVSEVRLVNPVINLEIDKQGRGNWLFDPVAPPSAAEQQVPPAERTSSGDFSFRDVTLAGGVLTYRDQRDGTSQRVEAINANVKLPSLDQPLVFDGGLTWNNEPVTIAATVANPRALSIGGDSGIIAKIDGQVLNAAFDGSVDAKTSAVKGKVDLATPSARRLAAWAGVELPNVNGFGALKLVGELEADGGRIAFKKATLSLDEMNGSGNLTLDTTRPKAHVAGDLTLDRLDLNAYTRGAGAKGGGGGARRTGAWRTSPIDFSALNAVDADFDFAVGALSVSDMKIGQSALMMALSEGKLRANLKQLSLYGGSGGGVVTLDGASAAQGIAADITLSGIQARSFLWDLAGFDRIEGAGSIVAKVTATGKSEQEWMRSLAGSAQIKFANGAIRGVDLAEIARRVESVLTGSAVGPSAKTSFSELSGSFRIKGGVAANRDLKLLNPYVRLNGAGIINIGSKTLDYRVEPKPVRSGRSGGGVLGGIGIPFRIRGPWANPSFEAGLAGALPDVLDSIIDGKNPLDNLTDGGLGDLLGSTKQESKGGKKKKPKGGNPLDPLKDLLGGGQ
jgi:AsmA protein